MAVARFADLVTFSATPMTLSTPDGRYLVVNEAFAALVGRPAAELLGLRYQQITHPQDREPADQVTDRALDAGERAATIDKRFLRPDGTAVDVRVAATIVRSVQGRQVCYLTHVTDLTELRLAQGRAQVSETNARRVVTSATDAYISIDTGGRVRDWNPAAVRMFGWSRADALGQDLAERIIPEELRAAHWAGLHRYLRTGEAVVLGRPIALTGVRRDGVRLSLEATIWASGDPDAPPTFHAFLRDISDRAAVVEAARRHELVFSSIGDAVILTGDDGRLVEVNPAAEGLFGRSRQELIGLRSTDLLDPDTPIDPVQVRARVAAEGFWAGDVEFTRPDGQRRTSAAVIRPLTDTTGAIHGYLAVHRDVTETRKALRALTEAEARYRLLAENSSDIISQIAIDGTVLYVSPSFERVFGKSPDHLIGGPVGGNAHPEDLPALREAFATVLSGTPVRMTGRRQRVDGTWVWLETSSEPMLDPTTGVVVGVQSSGRDITERKTAEAELERLALHDVLTGLANRALLTDRLHQAQQRLRREPAHIALLTVDLDRFKTINDTHGHAAGDAVLVEVAARLRSCARPTDTVARLGGDEFAVLLDRLTEPLQAEMVALRILGALRAPFQLPDGTDIEIRASIGYTVTHDPDQAAEQLHHDADLALYQAKAQGRDRAATLP